MDIQRQAERCIGDFGLAKGYTLSEIRAKNGLYLYRIEQGECSYVLKYFEYVDFRRELQYYEILQRIGVPTLPVIAASCEALLMEDIAVHPRRRLGMPEDMEDTAIAREIARWYKLLHEKSGGLQGEIGYSENDIFTRESIIRLEQRFPEHTTLWEYVAACYDEVQAAYRRFPLVLTYNDFYYSNLAVRRDGAGALLFDYNMMGMGYRYADVRNVLHSLGEDSRGAFLEEYGPVCAAEKLYDDATCDVITLINALDLPVLPRWAEPSLKRAADGSISRALEALLAGIV